MRPSRHSAHLKNFCPHGASSAELLRSLCPARLLRPSGRVVPWLPLIVDEDQSQHGAHPPCFVASAQLAMSVDAPEQFGRRVDAVFGALDSIAQSSGVPGFSQTSTPSSQWSITRQQVYRHANCADRRMSLPLQSLESLLKTKNVGNPVVTQVQSRT